MGNNKKKKEIISRLEKTNQINLKDKENQLTIIKKQEITIKELKNKSLKNLVQIGFIESNLFLT
ncbi:hypothetical protein [Tenacibaculum amylolyticum]|uniref:hypothetical protein n=1 Tax=Tenacibaculum amylolyticum TaxID=104269 RepID=UPI0038937361